jgi:hypothetical protein
LDIAKFLWKIDPGNFLALKKLNELLELSENNFIVEWTLELLWEIEPISNDLLERTIYSDAKDLIGYRDLRVKIENLNNSLAVEYFSKVTQLAETRENRLDAAIRLFNISNDNDIALSALLDFLKLANTKQPESIPSAQSAAWFISKSKGDTRKVVLALREIIQNSHEELPASIAVMTLAKLNSENDFAAQKLDELIKNSKNIWVRWHAAKCRGLITPQSKLAIATLEDLLGIVLTDSMQLKIAQDLQEIDPGNFISIYTIKRLIKSTQDDMVRSLAINYLSNFDVSKTIYLLEKLALSTHDDLMIWRIAHELLRLDAGSSIASSILEGLVCNSKDDWIRCQAASDLINENLTHWIAIQTLVEIVRHSTKLIGSERRKSVGINPDSVAIEKLYESLKLNHISNISDVAAAIIPLIRDKSFSQDQEKIMRYFSVIWHCSKRMSYPNFYKAWSISS